MPAYRKNIEISCGFFYNVVRRRRTIMPTEAQKKASKKYIENQLEMISIRIPKGEPAIFKAHAAKQGESLTAFLRRAALETIERDNLK